MRITMLCEFYSPELEFQENLLAKYYVKHGHEVTVLTSTFTSVFDYYNDRHDPRWPECEFIDHGARVVRLRYRYNLFNRIRPYRSIRSLLESTHPDLIYVHDIIPNLPEVIAYRKAHPECRVILDYHADYSNSGNGVLSRRILHGVIRRKWLDQARPYLSRIFPVVPASAVFLRDLYGVRDDEMEVLPLGADMDRVRSIPREDVRRELRMQYGIAESDVVIFTGGKLTPNRRTEVLLDAMAELQMPSLKAIIIGDSGASNTAYKDELESIARGRRDIVFTGWLRSEDIYRHMAAADLAVFPASQSILWQQCIAMGLPLVVGDIGSQDISYLNLADNIRVLKARDIRAEPLAAALRELLGSKARLQEMAKGARSVADEHLDWNKLIERTLRFNA